MKDKEHIALSNSHGNYLTLTIHEVFWCFFVCLLFWVFFCCFLRGGEGQRERVRDNLKLGVEPDLGLDLTILRW